MILYTDDSVLVCADNHIQTLKYKTEAELRKIEDWARINKISLNYKKTNCLLFRRSKSADVNDFFIDTSNGPLMKKNFVKYLGVIFDQKLSWKSHVQHVLAKLYI